MVQRNTIISIIFIAVIVSVAGYSVGLFTTPSEETITVTSSTTITTTSIRNMTETKTSTTINGKIIQIPSPANSTAIIRGHLIFNGSILVTYSIDKPSYFIGEIVHFESTITNLTPNNSRIIISRTVIDVRNITNLIWTTVHGTLGPYPGIEFDLLPGETKKIEKWMTADWNMKGNTGIYNSLFVAEGQYTVIWPSDIDYVYSGSGHWESIHEEITFTITNQN